LPNDSANPSAAVFLFPAGDGDLDFGIHDRRLNLADRWLADCDGSSVTSSLSAEAGVRSIGAVMACSVLLLPRCMTLSVVANLGNSIRRSSAGDFAGFPSAWLLPREGRASESGVVSPDELVETSSVLFSSSMEEESRVPSLLVESDCDSWTRVVEEVEVKSV
jgi:hypothetical protein